MIQVKVPRVKLILQNKYICSLEAGSRVKTQYKCMIIVTFISVFEGP